MDRVRFGRALGYGARHAAKSLMQAADAAASADPRKAAPAQTPQPVAARPAAQAARKVAEARVQTGRLKRSVWSPVAKFSSVLWLEVTGCFFALFALFIGQGLWKTRGFWRASPNSSGARTLYFHAIAFALFAYFAISSFVRASRRQRR